MSERQPGQRTARRADIPTIQLITGYTRMPPGPLALFEISLIAGDAEDAVLSVRARIDADPLICVVARAGGTARFVPAAPTIILDPLHVCIIGADAAGSVAYR